MQSPYCPYSSADSGIVIIFEMSSLRVALRNAACGVPGGNEALMTLLGISFNEEQQLGQQQQQHHQQRTGMSAETAVRCLACIAAGVPADVYSKPSEASAGASSGFFEITFPPENIQDQYQQQFVPVDPSESLMALVQLKNLVGTRWQDLHAERQHQQQHYRHHAGSGTNWSSLIAETAARCLGWVSSELIEASQFPSVQALATVAEAQGFSVSSASRADVERDASLWGEVCGFMSLIEPNSPAIAELVVKFAWYAAAVASSAAQVFESTMGWDTSAAVLQRGVAALLVVKSVLQVLPDEHKADIFQRSLYSDQGSERFGQDVVPRAPGLVRLSAASKKAPDAVDVVLQQFQQYCTEKVAPQICQCWQWSLYVLSQVESSPMLLSSDSNCPSALTYAAVLGLQSQKILKLLSSTRVVTLTAVSLILPLACSDAQTYQTLSAVASIAGSNNEDMLQEDCERWLTATASDLVRVQTKVAADLALEPVPWNTGPVQQLLLQVVLQRAIESLIQPEPVPGTIAMSHMTFIHNVLTEPAYRVNPRLAGSMDAEAQREAAVSLAGQNSVSAVFSDQGILIALASAMTSRWLALNEVELEQWDDDAVEFAATELGRDWRNCVSVCAGVLWQTLSRKYGDVITPLMEELLQNPMPNGVIERDALLHCIAESHSALRSRLSFIDLWFKLLIPLISDCYSRGDPLERKVTLKRICHVLEEWISSMPDEDESFWVPAGDHAALVSFLPNDLELAQMPEDNQSGMTLRSCTGAQIRSAVYVFVVGIIQSAEEDLLPRLWACIALREFAEDYDFKPERFLAHAPVQLVLDGIFWLVNDIADLGWLMQRVMESVGVFAQSCGRFIIPAAVYILGKLGAVYQDANDREAGVLIKHEVLRCTGALLEACFSDLDRPVNNHSAMMPMDRPDPGDLLPHFFSFLEASTASGAEDTRQLLDDSLTFLLKMLQHVPEDVQAQHFGSFFSILERTLSSAVFGSEVPAEAAAMLDAIAGCFLRHSTQVGSWLFRNGAFIDGAHRTAHAIGSVIWYASSTVYVDDVDVASALRTIRVVLTCFGGDEAGFALLESSQTWNSLISLVYPAENVLALANGADQNQVISMRSELWFTLGWVTVLNPSRMLQILVGAQIDILEFLSGWLGHLLSAAMTQEAKHLRVGICAVTSLLEMLLRDENAATFLQIIPAVCNACDHAAEAGRQQQKRRLLEYGHWINLWLDVHDPTSVATGNFTGWASTLECAIHVNGMFNVLMPDAQHKLHDVHQKLLAMSQGPM